MNTPNAQKNKTTVTICGKDYTMVGVESEEHIKRVAVYIDRKMDEMMSTYRLSQPMAAVLTAMNLADELMHAQDENTRLRRELMEMSEKLKKDPEE